jgi:hypothetical protein
VIISISKTSNYCPRGQGSPYRNRKITVKKIYLGTCRKKTKIKEERLPFQFATRSGGNR